MAKGNVIHVTAKCSDLFGMTVTNANGKEVLEYDGYVPDFFPGEHYGDYVILEIQADTGLIVNWKAPTKADLIDCIRE
jgi:hypothetical protein